MPKKHKPEQEQAKPIQTQEVKQAAPFATEQQKEVQQSKEELAEQPKTPATPSKQDATFNLLKEKWVARGVDLSGMTTRMEGKTLVIQVGETWPAIHVGAAGGCSLPQIRSYARALDACIIGDELLRKQNERDAKKAGGDGGGSAPAKQQSAAQPEQKQATTPAEKKQAQHAVIEKQFEAAVR